MFEYYPFQAHIGIRALSRRVPPDRPGADSRFPAGQGSRVRPLYSLTLWFALLFRAIEHSR